MKILAWIHALCAVSLLGLNPSVAAAAHRQRVLVFGGTGMIGSLLVRELAMRGDTVTVFVRPTSDRSVLDGAKIAFAVGDVLDPASLRAAFRLVRPEVVVSSIARDGHDRPTLEQGPTLYASGNDAITAAARSVSVRQLIQMSTLGAGDSAALVPKNVFEFAGQVFRDKTHAEQTLVASGLHYTIVRTTTMLVGPSSGMGQLSLDHSMQNPIHLGDVVRLVADCVGARSCYDHIYHTVDLTIPKLTAGELQAEGRKLGAYKLSVRPQQSPPRTSLPSPP